MNRFDENSGDNATQSISTERKRIFDRKHLILSPKHEIDHSQKLKFGDEPRITAAILPPPPAPTFVNSTKQIVKNDQFNQTNSTTKPSFISDNKSFSTNETSLLEDTSKVKSTTKLGSTTVRPPTTAPTNNEGDIGDTVSSLWKKMKQMLGFTPACQNGGHKNLRGLCECPRHFKGEFCQDIICLNNGTKTKIKLTVPQQEVCKCPHPQFITGQHCEIVNCKNGGKDIGNGTCKCIDNWYTGQFCQTYSQSWLAVVGVPLICVAIIILCCVVCRLDLCPRRSSRRRERERRRNNYGNYQMPPRRTYSNNHRCQQQQILSQQGISEQARMMQENILNDAAYRRNTRSRSNDTAANSNVYRLESIPTYNPEILNNSDYKIDVPPPSYEQATRCPPLVNPNAINSEPSALPNYSPPRSNTSRQNSSQRHENG